LRFFVPGQKEEYGVSVEPGSGTVIGFSRDLLDDAPGASIDKDRAIETARGFLTAHGVDPSSGELKEQSAKDEKARRDHTLVWEFPEPGAGEAKIRHEVIVQGDVVGSWGRAVKIPEDWRREREKSTALTVALTWAKLPLIGTAGFAALLLRIGKTRAGEIPWKLAVVAGGVSAAAAVVRTALNLDPLWERYDTAVPAGAYLIVIAIGLFLSAVLFFVAGAAV